MSEKKEQTFESAVKDLEKIVNELESGELDLDKSNVLLAVSLISNKLLINAI